MRFDNEGRLERLLERHPDATLVEVLPGRASVVRRDQLLVAVRDTPTVDDLLRRWIDRRDDEDAGVSRFRLRPKARVDVCGLVQDLHGPRHRRLAMSPNHLMHGEPIWWGGPADVPVPADPFHAPAATPSKRPVSVAVLDTGLASHPWFDGKRWFAEQHAGIAEVLDADLDFELDAQAGHGTFVAGVLLQQAPSAWFRIRRLLGSDGVCDELGLLQALRALREWSAESGKPLDVINLSFGCYTFDDRPSPLVAESIAAFGRQTVVVACAGNNASDRPFWPAALKEVVAVGALSADGHDRAAFSNYGWWVDACTVGEHVLSSFVLFDGPRPPKGDFHPDLFLGYAAWSGTSFAAPRVAGAVAALSASADIPASVALGRLLDPTKGRVIPDLGVVIPVDASGS